MRLRTKLIVAFLLLAVVPLTGATLYSYHASRRALQEAVQAESGALAREMEERVETVTRDLGRRIDRLSGLPLWAVSGTAPVPPEEMEARFRAEMGDAARFLQRLEFRPDTPEAPEAPAPGMVIVDVPGAKDGDPEGAVQLQFNVDLQDAARPAQLADGRDPPFQFETDEKGALILQIEPDAAEARPEGAPDAPAVATATEDLAGQEFLRGLETLSRELEARHQARQAGIEVPAADEAEMRGRLTGQLGMTPPERIGLVRAQVNSREVLRQVMSRTRRDRGEIPFAVDGAGNLYTPDPADRSRLETLDLERLVREGDVPADGALIGDWVTVLRMDPNTDLYFGIARPVANSLQQLQATAARNLGLGLGFVGLALLGILPLSGRMTRNLASLTEGARTLARGDLSARVPVRSRDEIGMLSSAFNRMAEDLGESQKRLVEQERMRRELEIGRQIQQELLPRDALRLPLVEIQGISIPAREVSGDFHNYYSLSERSVTVIVGDVSGKGVPAALLMANVQASLRALLVEGGGLSPLVHRLDREVDANTPTEVYATLFVGILEAVEARLRYVNAGHNPPLVLHPDGRIERLDPGGRPVGLLPGSPYPEREVRLHPGSLLFLYSDGLVESENPAGEPFGTERVEAILRHDGHAALPDLLARLEEAVRLHRADAEPADDATLLALRYLGATVPAAPTGAGDVRTGSEVPR